ncbi:protein HP-25 homolog 1-like [Babylonia areolata]|uniref:protein HP-25 homolog 1-like n=1 Tax=Babylonia areolata TaxID=304850 RepID=UPI003FD247F8
MRRCFAHVKFSMISKTVCGLMILAAMLAVTSSGHVVKPVNDTAAVLRSHEMKLASLQAHLRALENGFAYALFHWRHPQASQALPSPHNHTHQTSSGNCGCAPATQQVAAFRADLGHADVAANAPIRFATTFVAGQGDYNPHTGIYTVFIPGVYLFGVQLFPQTSFDYHLDLYVSGGLKIRSRCNSNVAHHTSCSTSSVLRVQKGDTVWVQTWHGAKYWLGAHTFFYGALLSPSDP